MEDGVNFGCVRELQVNPITDIEHHIPSVHVGKFLHLILGMLLTCRSTFSVGLDTGSGDGTTPSKSYLEIIGHDPTQWTEGTHGDAQSTATVFAEKGWRKATKWAYLLNRSTTTRTKSNVRERGRPSIKSIEISFQIRFGMGRGCSKPASERAWALFC
ncbi:hypothetical protein E5676_scaffold701G00440 [Cucumis melo var. makuwa]|uniref:Uncharacterized protein n=1 Tax=Cucumis melo var. makuwa TaxID=1194695 RepID=A0A5A7UQ90_CUCMM|nr:hypothetical protein E6C27_scaffold486G00940 [Cucumis melo var. makuwa]TYJ99921.1 hypothetical protein E5676_scaffold701G00440 [Cucumis melo var. makuwa]